MLTTQCSFCHRENTPSARFCIECGSPMHLKVCANAECGKVSDVSATVCEHCGTNFPKIALVSSAPPSTKVPVARRAEDKPPTRAWPLIMVAVVAGGMPLLWANRSSLPTPKTWQFSTPNAAPAVQAPPAPVAPAVQAPTEVARPPAAPAPVAAETSAAAPILPAPAELETKGVSPPATTQAGTDVARAVPKKPVKAAQPKIAEPKECTEAVAALGLCKFGAAKK